MSTALAMTATDARALTDRIKVGVEAIWELIKQAYTERAWDALGYESWDDYCTREFGTSRLRLPREERTEVVASLRESGLSERAIASATGLGKGTVHRELAGGPNGAPEPEPVDAEVVDEVAESLSDGDDELADALTESLIAAEPDLPPLPENYMNGQVAQPKPAPEPRSVIGTDGKKYNPKPSTPQQPKRKPLPETFDRAKQDLRSVVERVARLIADDRLEKNKDQIVGANLSDLIRARDALTRVIQHLEG